MAAPTRVTAINRMTLRVYLVGISRGSEPCAKRGATAAAPRSGPSHRGRGGISILTVPPQQSWTVYVPSGLNVTTQAFVQGYLQPLITTVFDAWDSAGQIVAGTRTTIENIVDKLREAMTQLLVHPSPLLAALQTLRPGGGVNPWVSRHRLMQRIPRLSWTNLWLGRARPGVGKSMPTYSWIRRQTRVRLLAGMATSSTSPKPWARASASTTSKSRMPCRGSAARRLASKAALLAEV